MRGLSNTSAATKKYGAQAAQRNSTFESTSSFVRYIGATTTTMKLPQVGQLQAYTPWIFLEHIFQKAILVPVDMQRNELFQYERQVDRPRTCDGVCTT